MLYRLILAALCCVVFSVNAEARQRHRAVLAHPECNVTMPCIGVSPSPRGERIVKAMGFGSAQQVYAPASVRQKPSRHRKHQRTETVLHGAVAAVQRVSAAVVSHPSGCPARAFCGCGAAVRIFGSPVRSLWLAANWYRFPRSAPAPGAVAVRRHHVFVLEQHLGGNVWLAYDANSGRHLTRVHARSIAGYTIVNPRGAA